MMFCGKIITDEKRKKKLKMLKTDKEILRDERQKSEQWREYFSSY